MIENMEIIPQETVIQRVHELFDAEYRYVTITCCENKDGSFDLFYSFDRKLELVNLKTTVPAGNAVKSISHIYIAAAFAENEISELFGLTFEDLVIDYGGRFMITQDAPQSPFGSGIIIERKDGGSNAG